MGDDNYCGDRSHMYHFLRLTSSEMRSVLFDPTYEFALFIGVNCPTVASKSDPGSHTARFWEICTRDPKSSLTSEVRQLWFLVVQRETLYGKIVTQNQFGLRLGAISLSRPRVTDSPHQNREQHRANRSTYAEKNVPKDAHAELVFCVTFLHGGVLNWK